MNTVHIATPWGQNYVHFTHIVKHNELAQVIIRGLLTSFMVISHMESACMQVMWNFIEINILKSDHIYLINTINVYV